MKFSDHCAFVKIKETIIDPCLVGDVLGIF